MEFSLRPFDERDFRALSAWVSSAEDLSQWCGAFFKYPLDDAQLRQYLESATKPNVREIFTVTESGRPVGHIELSMIWPHLSCRLSRVLVAPEERRRGVAQAAVRLAASRGFEHFHVDRIDLGVADVNQAAIGCYAKQGFVPVGTWPEGITTPEGPISVVWMTFTRQT